MIFGSHNYEASSNPNQKPTVKVMCDYCGVISELMLKEITLNVRLNNIPDGFGEPNSYEFDCQNSVCQNRNKLTGINDDDIAQLMSNGTNLNIIKVPDEVYDPVRCSDYDESAELSLDWRIELGLNGDSIVETLLREDSSKITLIRGTALRWALEQLQLDDQEANS